MVRAIIYDYFNKYQNFQMNHNKSFPVYHNITSKIELWYEWYSFWVRNAKLNVFNIVIYNLISSI